MKIWKSIFEVIGIIVTGSGMTSIIIANEYYHFILGAICIVGGCILMAAPSSIEYEVLN